LEGGPFGLPGFPYDELPVDDPEIAEEGILKGQMCKYHLYIYTRTLLHRHKTNGKIRSPLPLRYSFVIGKYKCLFGAYKTTVLAFYDNMNVF